MFSFNLLKFTETPFLKTRDEVFVPVQIVFKFIHCLKPAAKILLFHFNGDVNKINISKDQ